MSILPGFFDPDQRFLAATEICIEDPEQGYCPFRRRHRLFGSEPGVDTCAVPLHLSQSAIWSRVCFSRWLRSMVSQGPAFAANTSPDQTTGQENPPKLLIFITLQPPRFQLYAETTYVLC